MAQKRSNGSKQQTVTIFDVAERAGVSYGTVSRVINDSPHVRPETRERIHRVMDELGFVANRQARSLAGGSNKTNIIGVLVPDLASEYMGEILRGIDAELTLSNLDLILYTTHRIANKEATYIANLARDMVDGLLLVIPRQPADYIGVLTERNFPFVLIDHQGTSSNCPAVGATNWQGAFNATEYLVGLGHKRIGFITGWKDLGCSFERLEGYRAALRSHHLPVDPELVYEGTFHRMNGYDGACALLNIPNPPSAIFASNDVMAFGVIDAVRNKGLRVPEDVSVVGFDDIPPSSLMRPALTTVKQPLEKMGRLATQMLIDMLKAPGVVPRRIELPTELVRRDSCQAMAGA